MVPCLNRSAFQTFTSRAVSEEHAVPGTMLGMNGWVLNPGVGFATEYQAEAEAIAATFGTRHGHLLEEIPPGAVVVPRFRAIPFGADLEQEVRLQAATLINSYGQHRFAADLGQWAPVLGELTPTTWSSVADIPAEVTGPFIVKGETNSRRQCWTTHCFAPDRAALEPTLANLQDDALIGHQHLYIRRYVPLHELLVDWAGMPISEEYRVFMLDGVELARGFYWANQLPNLTPAGFVPQPESVPADLLAEVGRLLVGHIRFVAVDLARTATDDWIVIEINDGSMAGLCDVDATALWSSFAARL